MATATMTMTAPTKRLHVQPLQAVAPLQKPVPRVVKPSATDFSWTSEDEPHAKRRAEILKAHPEVRQLLTTEPRTFWMVLGCIVAQLTMCYIVSADANLIQSYWTLLFLSYLVGGTINHSLQLAVHELSHNLCFQTPLYNRLTALLANLPTGVPSAVTFQRYHMDHHQWQGYDGIDVDIPSFPESQYVTSVLLKACWVMVQPLAYALRPMLVAPKEPTRWEAINYATAISFDVFLYYMFGSRALVYTFCGTLLGLGLHPCAGHFIAEHYELVTGQETYSYYGICNYFNFNVGYHNEHHDFPKIPWSKLPALKAMAPEFYDTLPSHTSYLEIFRRFIFDDQVNCTSRIKRETIPHSDPTKRVMDSAYNHDEVTAADTSAAANKVSATKRKEMINANKSGSQYMLLAGGTALLGFFIVFSVYTFINH